MKPGDVAVWVLLGIAIVSTLVTAVGILTARNVYVRLHYMGPVASVGALAVAAAIAVHGPASAGVKAILAGLILFIMNPVLTHATARAARTREHGNWQPRESEHIETASPEEVRR